VTRVPGRSHFAAPLLLAVAVALIVYASLYPFRFQAGGPPVFDVLRQLAWDRASRGDTFNNVLLYVPLGFCLALLVEPRHGRLAALVVALLGGSLLSVAMEVTQASIATRVPSLRDLSLNAAGSLAGAVGGSAWHALGGRMTPRAGPHGRSGAVAVSVLVLWLFTRLWPLVPDPSLRQLKRAVRPLFSPQIEWQELAAYFIGWLVVAQTVLHLARRDRSTDVLLLVITVVLVGRTFLSGGTLEPAELAALALLVPALALVSRLQDRTRSALVAALLGTGLAAVALAPMLGGATTSPPVEVPAVGEILGRPAPAPPQLAGKAFSYVALAWLLTGTGLYPHVAAGFTVLFVLLLVLLQAGVTTPAYGWADLVVAVVGALVVLRWTPRAGPR